MYRLSIFFDTSNDYKFGKNNIRMLHENAKRKYQYMKKHLLKFLKIFVITHLLYGPVP